MQVLILTVLRYELVQEDYRLAGLMTVACFCHGDSGSQRDHSGICIEIAITIIQTIAELYD